MTMRHVPLHASEPPRVAAMLPLSKPALEQQVRVTLIARTGNDAARRSDARATGVALPRDRVLLEAAAFESRYGASEADLEPLAGFVRSEGFEVESVDPASRCVIARASAARVAEAFQVEPVHSVGEWGLHRSHRGSIHVPEALAQHLEAVLGLDDLPVAQPHVFHRRRDVPHVSPAAVAKHYAFPDGRGHGRRVAIIELGGGFHQADLDAYARRHRFAQPAIEVRGVDGANNRPADAASITKVLEMMGMSPHQVSSGIDSGAPGGAERNAPGNVLWTIESTMDIEIVAALAGEAQITVYFAPNTAQGKYHAIAAALRDEPDVISISWGGREERRTRSQVDVMEALFEQAALQGATVCCSSGDDGALQYPASSPYVLGCGGTRLHDERGVPVHETVWNEPAPALECRRFCSSGGVSHLFKEAPDWQASARVTAKTGEHGRGVPDVAGKADVVAGYDTIVGGEDIALGGTSAAAPLWAALIARLNEHLEPHGTRAGYLTPLLYRDGSPFRGALRGVHKGSSGSYQAAEGWNPCTGLGTPDGVRLLAALVATSTAAERTESQNRE